MHKYMGQKGDLINSHYRIVAQNCKSRFKGMGLQELRAIISKCAPENLREDIERLGIIKATVHTPVYTMHKFWARRPWIVFRKLILLFTRPGDIILDPFAGGGVTLVEGLITRRRVIAIDLNPLAVKIMKYEVMPLNVELYRKAVKRLKEILEPVAAELYKAKCPKSGQSMKLSQTHR
jgi:hypothetical protein